MEACGIDPDGADRHVSRPKIVKQRTQGKSRMKRSSRNYAEGESPRERIVNAARRLFGSKGFYATTTAELAEEASVIVGQIYRLFTDKDDVILAIVERSEEHSVGKECGSKWRARWSRYN